MNVILLRSYNVIQQFRVSQAIHHRASSNSSATVFLPLNSSISNWLTAISIIGISIQARQTFIRLIVVEEERNYWAWREMTLALRGPCG